MTESPEEHAEKSGDVVKGLLTFLMGEFDNNPRSVLSALLVATGVMMGAGWNRKAWGEMYDASKPLVLAAAETATKGRPDLNG